MSKSMTFEKDIVLIYYEETPLAFARIEEIWEDDKPDWFHVKLLFLQLPVHSATWILRGAYIDGDEFTMGGKRMRLEKVVCPEEERGEDFDTPEMELKEFPEMDASIPLEEPVAVNDAESAPQQDAEVIQFPFGRN
ncbi:MAG: hypothetical protein MI742_18210 [Desulfobacterales bacterium]|nr:hypothetical protein [Desulfobacterales bacterium]